VALCVGALSDCASGHVEGRNNMTFVNRVRVAATAAVVAGLMTVVGTQAALGAEAGFGRLYLNGQVVGTVVTPAQVAPGSGRDPFYKVANGAAGQLGIAGVGPGSGDYHGGDWEVFTVTFNVTPYLLTSGSAVATAAAKGDVTVSRQPAQDFRCPITSTTVG
jgi:hypothetical protein